MTETETESVVPFLADPWNQLECVERFRSMRGALLNQE